MPGDAAGGGFQHEAGQAEQGGQAHEYQQQPGQRQAQIVLLGDVLAGLPGAGRPPHGFVAHPLHQMQAVHIDRQQRRRGRVDAEHRHRRREGAHQNDRHQRDQQGALHQVGGGGGGVFQVGAPVGDVRHGQKRGLHRDAAQGVAQGQIGMAFPGGGHRQHATGQRSGGA